jgi:uncharacterized protein DUF4282
VLSAGAKLGSYEILAAIGAGGMGISGRQAEAVCAARFTKYRGLENWLKGLLVYNQGVQSNTRRRSMPVATGMWEGLLDFSFRAYATPRMLKVLYALHLFVGLIAGVAWVVMAFQVAPVNGLLAILGAVVGYFFWVLYCRIALEVLAAVFRMADAIAPDREAAQRS